MASEAAVPQESLATAQATPSEPGAPAEETREDGELQETAAGRPGVSAELLSKLGAWPCTCVYPHANNRNQNVPDASDALKLSLEDPSLQSVVRGILTSKQPLDELAVALHDHPELASLAALVHGIVDSDALLKQQRHHS